MALDRRHEAVEVHRFAEEAGLMSRARRETLWRDARHDDDGDVRQRRERAESADQLPTVHDGHVEVDQHHTRLQPFLKQEESVTPGGAPDGAQPLHPKKLDETFPQGRVVIHDEDVGPDLPGVSVPPPLAVVTLSHH
jgi:hypothetical protein